jgi:putative transposase
MQLVQQVQLKASPLLDEITFCSKNLYNVAVYTVRQQLFRDSTWLRYTDLYRLLKDHETYLRVKELGGSHPPQQVLKQVDRNFKAFFRAMRQWKKCPQKFQGRPKLPTYKRKAGKNVVIFTSQQCRVRGGVVVLTRNIMRRGFPRLPTTLPEIKGVRTVPYGDRYTVELIYDYGPEDLGLDKTNVLAIDIGLTNLITAVDTLGERPMIIKGGVAKSINQYYNKQLAKYKSLAKKLNNTHTTTRIQRTHRKRNNKVCDLFHKASRKVINYCIDHNIGTIVVGYNEGWKQNVRLGRRTNQQFVSLPFYKLLHQLEYKAEMVGITVVRTTEEYTSLTCSVCGVVDRSNRTYRGLYVCSTCGAVLNADVNASRNILRKGVPKSLVRIGARGTLNVPLVFTASPLEHNPRIHGL